MEDKLEQLLNMLIQRGWKPFGDESVSVEHLEELVRFYYKDKKSCIETLRTMTSKESNLWQFVCENGMLKKEWEYRAKRRHCHWWEHDEDFYHDISYVKKHDYEYRLIESALKDESELEEFLLDNIKVDEI